MAKIIKLMRRTFTYLLLAGLIAIGLYATYTAFYVKPEPEPYKFVTRNAVDSVAVRQHLEIKPTPPQREQEPIQWGAITSAIVALTVAGAGIGFNGFKKEVNDRFNQVHEHLKIVTDQKSRSDIDSRLVKIEQDAAGFATDDNVRSLIEGIGSRTRSFCRDVMETQFTENCMQKATLKMNARAQDCKHHVKDLGFSNYFETQINEIRSRNLKRLSIGLSRLVEDRINNSRYERFGDIVCDFLQRFLKEVVVLHYENRDK